MANNENINKVVYGNTTLIDLTEDSVTPQTLLEGETAHDKSGAQITGSAVVNTVIEESDSFALVPTSEGNALARKIYGMSVQDGTPTPSSPVDIESASADFKCVGKNLIPYPYNINVTGDFAGGGSLSYQINADGSITISGTANNNNSRLYISRTNIPFNVKNGIYTISAGVTSTKYRLELAIFNNGSYQNVVYKTSSGDNTFELTDTPQRDCLVFYIVIDAGATLPVTFKPMLRLASVADATYEPYKHTDITTSLTLRSIEVTSSDHYNLVKDGKYYIADTIDWDEVDGYTLTKRVGHEAITTANYYQDRGNNLAQFNSLLAGKAMFLVKGNRSNRFIPDSTTATRENGEFYIDNTTNTHKFVGFVQDASITSIATATTWLSNNETYIEYILATPIKTSLTSEQAKALLSMRTYDESTSIDAVNAPAPVVELEYAKNRTSGRALTGHNEGKIDKGYEHISYSEYLQLTPQQIASGKYIVEGSGEAIGIFGKVLTGSLAVGSTTVVLQDSFITTTSMIDVYTDVYGVSPTDVTVATGSITLTFEAQESILNVKVRVM